MDTPNITLFLQKTQSDFLSKWKTHLQPGHYLTFEGIGDQPGQAPNFLEVIIAIGWIGKYCKRRKTINRDVDAYLLKHAAEGSRYISPGAFCQAAILCGYEYHVLGSRVCFNVALKRNPEGQHYEDMFLPWDGE